MRKVLPLLWFSLVFVFTFLQNTSAQSDPPLLLRFPTVSQTQIVFNYAGDLWTVEPRRGDARRLTSGVGIETLHTSPRMAQWSPSPANMTGTAMSTSFRPTGGVPRRLTYHPADEVRGWLDSRWQEGRVQLLGQQLHPLRGSALYGPGRRRPAHAGAASRRRGSDLLARWNARRLRSASQVAASLEALPRRPDHAYLDRRSQRLQHRENSPRQFQRRPPHVGGRHDLFSFRPQRPGQPLRLRHEDQASFRSTAQ